jgi:ubiquinone/menaquinone biosynthesis C-methylase UbiE
VLELGAGTGKLTRVLVGLGHDVHATDPDEAMLAILEAQLPGVRTAVAGAEEIPLADGSVDAVIAAQAFHWFDLDRALPEISRVLVPGGRICLVWNQRNEKIPWVRRLGALIGTQEQLRDPAQALIFSELFGFVEEREFSHWQMVDRKTIQDLVLSRSNVAVLDAEGRAASWPRCSRSTTTTAAGWTACSFPTSPAASSRPPSTGRPARSRTKARPVRRTRTGSGQTDPTTNC